MGCFRIDLLEGGENCALIEILLLQSDILRQLSDDRSNGRPIQSQSITHHGRDGAK